MNENRQAAPLEGQSFNHDDARALYYYLELAAALRRVFRSAPALGTDRPPHPGGLMRDLLSVSSAYALLPQDLVAPAPFTCGAALVRGIPAARLLSVGVQAARAFDITDPSVGLLPPTREHGGALSPAVGAALAAKQRSETRIVLAHLAAPACEAGDFHEALNMAAVMRVALVVLVEREDAGAITHDAHRRTAPASRAAGYGVAVRTAEAQDPGALFATIREAADWAREEGRTVVVDASISSAEARATDAADTGASGNDSAQELLAYFRDRRLITDSESMALRERVENEVARSMEQPER